MEGYTYVYNYRNAGDSYEDISINPGHGSMDFIKKQCNSDSALRRQITKDNHNKYMEEQEKKKAEWLKKQDEKYRATS